MASFDISIGEILLAVFLRLYLTIVFWSFPIAAVLAVIHRRDENKRKYRVFLIWSIIAGIPWIAQLIFWITGISRMGTSWLLGG